MDISDKHKQMGLGGCCCFICIWIIIIVITILASIRSLGPHEQILEHGPEGKKVFNGPRGAWVVHPFRKREYRKAQRIGLRDYLVVKNHENGLIRHVEGDGEQLFFLGAWDESLGIKRKITLRQHQYCRLIDELTGYERVVRGPMLFMPNPLESMPNGTEQGIVITQGQSILTINKTQGVRKVYTTTGVFIPSQYEEILEVRRTIPVGDLQYAKVKDLRSGAIRHDVGPQLKLGAYEELIEGPVEPHGLHMRVSLRNKEYARLVDFTTGEERVVEGPLSLIPSPTEESKTIQMKQQAITIQAQTGVLVINRTSGVEELITQVGRYIPPAYVDVIEVRRSVQINEQYYAVVKRKLDGSKYHLPFEDIGNERFIVPAYEELLGVKRNIILGQDEYIRLVNRSTGEERIQAGPTNFVPDTSEFSPDSPDGSPENGKQKAQYIDAKTALIVLDRRSGLKELKQKAGRYIPDHYESIVEIRQKIALAQWESMIVRSDDGQLFMKSGRDVENNESAASFFLDAYQAAVTMDWSQYEESHKDGIDVPKKRIDKIDMRKETLFFSVQARTQDGVKLKLDGTIEWKPCAKGELCSGAHWPDKADPVVIMVENTADPPQDIWYHCRSKLIQQVGAVGIEALMNDLAKIKTDALKAVRDDLDFYLKRGIEVLRLDISSNDAVETSTRDILNQIAEMKITQENERIRQIDANERAELDLVKNITSAKQQYEIISIEEANAIMQEEINGEAEGLVELESVKTFLDNMGNAVTDEQERINIYKMQEMNKARTEDIENMKDGKVKVIMAPSVMDTRLDMSGADRDGRRLVSSGHKGNLMAASLNSMTSLIHSSGLEL